jgi:DNA-binding response OmpR family regulator
MWDAISSLLKAVSTRRPEGKEHSRRQSFGHDHKAHSSITILSVLGTVSDRNLIDEVSRRNQWSMGFASTSDEARDALKRTQPQIILVDRDIVGPDWRYAVSSLVTASGGACVLLISKVIDDYLWNEVVINGGYDVLRKPLNEDDVLRNVKLAWSYWYGTRRVTGRAATK